MRPKSETIGALGRSPARTSHAPPRAPEPPRPPRSPGPETGALSRWLHGALFDNVALKFLSLVLAVTVFLLVNTDREREIGARVGVSYDAPKNMVLVGEHVDEVHVTIKGPSRALRRFDERHLDRLNLQAQAGAIALTPDMIRYRGESKLPGGLHITSITPRTVRVAFERRVEKVIEVSPVVAGATLHGYFVSELKPQPSTIKVRGAESTLAALSTIGPRISVEGRSEPFVAEAELALPDGVELDSPTRVLVRVSIEEELVTRKMPAVAIVARGDGVDAAKWTITPAQVEVTLTGTLLAVEKARAAIVPIVKLSATDAKPHEVDVTIDGLPPRIGVEVSPARVKVAPNK